MTDKGRGRILVADDEPAIRRFVEGHLRSAGYDVYTAGSGEEVVALADLRRPDLVVLDVEMPDMDGLDACHRIRATREDKPAILFITGHRDETILRLASVAGGEDLLPKPFSSSELLHRAAALLEDRRLARERPEPKCFLVPRFAKTDARELLDDVVTRAAARLRLRDHRLRARVGSASRLDLGRRRSSEPGPREPDRRRLRLQSARLADPHRRRSRRRCGRLSCARARLGHSTGAEVLRAGRARPRRPTLDRERRTGRELLSRRDSDRPRPGDREDRSPADEALQLKAGPPC
jgi:DNA-binding response OmpR family regulator